MTSPGVSPPKKSRPSGHALREKLQLKLEEEGEPELAAKLIRCQETMRITCTSCGHEKEVETRCKQRWCPVCAVKISLRRIARFEEASRRCQWPLMLTLTMKNTKSAQDAATTIIPAFTKFRRTVFWKKNVKGGVASYEVTNKGRGWHPHLHILCDCRWLALNTQEPRRTDHTDTIRHKLRSAQRELSQAWAGATGQKESIVWARRAYGDHLSEALKYNLKPSELIECQGKIGPLLWALKGKRLVVPFGSFYDLGEKWKSQDEEAKEACKCIECNAARSYLPNAVIEMMKRTPMSSFHSTKEKPSKKRKR